MGEEASWQPDGVPLRLNPEARSAEPSLPAFLARPEDAPSITESNRVMICK